MRNTDWSKPSPDPGHGIRMGHRWMWTQHKDQLCHPHSHAYALWNLQLSAFLEMIINRSITRGSVTGDLQRLEFKADTRRLVGFEIFDK